MRIFQKYLPLCIGILLFCACGNEVKNASQDNPVFKQPQLAAISEKIKSNPENAELYFERGNLLHKLEEDSLALIDFKKAATLDSSKAAYFSAVGDLLFEHKDVEGSVSWIETSVKLNPEDPKARMKIAKMLVFIREYSKALEEINTALRQNSMNPEGYFLKGIIYKDLKDTAKAISSFRTALQVSPEYKDAAIQLGVIYSSKKDPLALKYFDNAFRLDTLDMFPLYAKGMFFQEQEKYEEAKKEYVNCLSHNPGFSDAYFNIGWILLQQDSLEKARRQFDLVTQLEPTDASAYYNRGLCSELMNRKREALDDYNQALVFDKDYKEAKDGVKRLSQ